MVELFANLGGYWSPQKEALTQIMEEEVHRGTLLHCDTYSV